jgi:hypothetical protein
MNPILCMLGMVMVVEPWQPQLPVEVAPDGITQLEAGLGPALATATIHTLKLEKGAQDGGERNRGFHCSGGWNPCSPVLDLEFEVDGRRVFVPDSVYADLADVNTAELRETGGTVTLHLTCGDASGSYSVRITFDAQRVLKRQVIAAFGTNEVAEETTYFEGTPLD